MCVLLKYICVDVNNVINNESVALGTQQGAVFIVALTQSTHVAALPGCHHHKLRLRIGPTYRVRYKHLTVFEIRKTACPLSAATILTVVVHSDIWS